MTDSIVTVTNGGKGGIMFAGPDATELFRAVALKSALKLLKVGITPSRGITKRKALDMVPRYSGQKYKNTPAEIDRAVADLDVWINTMKAALPIVHKEC